MARFKVKEQIVLPPGEYLLNESGLYKQEGGVEVLDIEISTGALTSPSAIIGAAKTATGGLGIPIIGDILDLVGMVGLGSIKGSNASALEGGLGNLKKILEGIAKSK